ncbi:MAG TPA: hypothetical protein VK698_25195 [Kofleriaceae bacterium]|nr:hypothetical protein [Kofleriaceae bacterium]
MSVELSQNRTYLGENRRRIIARSLASAAAGALPIPVLEDWLESRIRRGTIRKIAESRSVDASESAIRAVADGKEKPPEWAELVGGSIAYRFLARQWRRLVVVYLVARRAQAASRSFLVSTLFDHYCARLHVGMGLDAGRAAELRGLIDRAIAETPGGLGRRMFRRGALGAARAGVKAPIRLADVVTRGMVRRLLSRNDEVEAEQVVEAVIERQLETRKGVLARSVAAMELQLAAEANPYVDNLIDAFDRLWRERQAERSRTPDGGGRPGAPSTP